MGDESIDRLLECALETYSSVKLRPGLEQRVLSRALAEPPRRRFGWLGWAAVPALAGAVWTVISIPRVPPPPAAPRPPVFVAVSLPPRPAVVRPVRRAAHPRRQEALPKRTVFPTPSPLSGEERILLAFATHSPEKAAEAFRETPPQKIQPIVIPPLETNDATQ